MNSKKFADRVLLFLKKYITYDHKKELLVHYGLETIYIFITKIIFLTLLSIILGITREMYIFIFFYGMLRLFAGGMHLSTSLGCSIFSAIVLLSLPYVATYTNLNHDIRIIIFGICISIFALYSPADTIKKPMINENRRIKNKIKSLLICSIYFILIFIIDNRFVLNCITYSIILQSCMIHPLFYKIFNQSYNNYINYSD